MRRAGLVVVVALAGCGDDEGGGEETVTTAAPRLLPPVVAEGQPTLREVDVRTSTAEEQVSCLGSPEDPFVGLDVEDGEIERAEVVAHLRTYGWSPVEGLATGPGELVLVRRYLTEPGFEDPGFEAGGDVDPRTVEATLTLRADEAVVRVVDPPPCA